MKNIFKSRLHMSTSIYDIIDTAMREVEDKTLLSHLVGNGFKVYFLPYRLENKVEDNVFKIYMHPALYTLPDLKDGGKNRLIAIESDDLKLDFNFFDVGISNPARIAGISCNKITPDNVSSVCLAEHRIKQATLLKMGRLPSILKIANNEVIKKIGDILGAKAKEENQFNNLFLERDITRVYNLDHATSNTIGRSCMRGEKFFELYDTLASKGKLEILYLCEDEALIGRALVWKDAKINTADGDTVPVNVFMDRIYSNNSVTEQLFKNYAHKNGWAHKENQDNDECFNIVLNRERIENVEVVVTADGVYIDEMVHAPYLDSLRYANIEDGVLHLSNSNEYFQEELRSTDGENPFNSGDTETCEHCGYTERAEDMRETSDGLFFCSDCQDEDTFYCDYHGRWENEYSDTNRYHVEDYGDVCECGYSNLDAFCCDWCGDHYSGSEHNDTLSDGHVCDRCLKDNYTQCDNCGNYERDEDIITHSSDGSVELVGSYCSRKCAIDQEFDNYYGTKEGSEDEAE